MATNFDVLDKLYPLPPQQLFRQWALSKRERDVPAGWQRRTVGGWHLIAHPDAKVCRLRARDGAEVGWAIEPLAYLDQAGDALVGDELTLPVDAHAAPGTFECALYGRDDQGRSTGDGLEGAWVAAVFGGPPHNRFSRVYLGAAHSVVYSEQHACVAPTHNLILGLRRHEALSRAFDPLMTRSYFTFGLTAFEGLRRLLPNHYLDLETFQASRHWPSASLAPLDNGGDGAVAVVEHARRLLRVIHSEHERFKVFLSAGRDSRAVLAFCRPLVEGGADVLLATSVGRDLESRTDLQAARRLARIAGLPHEVKKRRRHSGDAPDVMRAFVRTGETMAGRSLSKPGGAGRRAPDPRFKVAGMAGETGRAYFWKGRPLADEVTPEEVARKTKSPVTGAVVEAAGRWLAGVPTAVRSNPHDTLDLAYVEQRLGCWESPCRYVFPGRPRTISPMISAFNIETMLRLPADYRAAGVLQRDMVGYGWPELLAVPFNEPTGLLRLSRPAGRARFYLRAIRRKIAERSGAGRQP